MGKIGGFLGVILVWLIFFIFGVPFLANYFEQEDIQSGAETTPHVTAARFTETPDLTRISGEQVVGMVPYALSGEFVLRIDNIRIDSQTDIDMLNLSNVIDQTYKLTYQRDQEAQVQIVNVQRQ